MINAERRARKLIASRSTEDIIKYFESTFKWTGVIPNSVILGVRDLYMDELKSRDAEAFDKWLDSKEDSPRKFYL